MKLKNFLNYKNLNKYKLLTQKIKGYEQSYIVLKKEELAEKFQEVKKNKHISKSHKILHAMALAKVAAKYVFGYTYYDVQLMGALALIDGCIAEMKTGEGKTLTCSAAVAANFMLDFKTHVATANEYLAQRDQETLKPLYDCLGISSSYNNSKMEAIAKKQSYQNEVVYSTAQEFGFDYLRDNLVLTLEEKVQPLDFQHIKAIIDEVDFILIDEARTPLIISGEAPIKEIDIYNKILSFVPLLKKMKEAPEESNIFLASELPDGDFWLDEKHKAVYLSESGYEKLERLALENNLIQKSFQKEDSALYHQHYSWIVHEMLNALKANYLYVKNKDYIIKNNEVVIIDPNTGRLSEGRSWSQGLHQAVEAKEKVIINPETRTVGSISIQNYFRIYHQISGMSGTVMQSSEEFEEIYQSKTIQIPTNKPMIRKNHEDHVYLTMNVKYKKIIEDIQRRHKKGQPILIGTTSVAESEIISELLEQKKIKHHVLNAKNHAKEAKIIAQAGKPYAVTVSTSMSGRGTDIILGGNKELLFQIYQQQKQQIEERKVFFKNIFEQIQELKKNISYQENQDDSLKIQENLEYDEIEEYIQKLYELDFINYLSNKPIEFVEKYLESLLEIIEYQEKNVRDSWEKWHEQVLLIGGLCVIGSSRNESRRIDEQLRGRAGRQGDPGESIFYLSLEDSWLNIFGKNPIFQKLAQTLPQQEVIVSKMLTKAIIKAQQSIESLYFGFRKDTFQYDSVADEGRKQFFQIRNQLLANFDLLEKLIEKTILYRISPLSSVEFIDFFENKISIKIENEQDFWKNILTLNLLELDNYSKDFMVENPYISEKYYNQEIVKKLEEKIKESIYKFKKHPYFQDFCKAAIIELDKQWTNHLSFIEEAQKNVSFRTMAQQNPLYEYKKICFESFSFLIENFKLTVAEQFMEIIKPQENNIFKLENESFE